MVTEQRQKIPHKLIISIILISTFLFTFNQFLLITAFPTIMQEFSINATQVQWLTTSFLLTTIVFIPMSGYLTSRFSSRALVLFSLACLVSGTIVGIFASTFMLLILSRVIQAIGAGIMLPLVQTILLAVFPKEKQGFAMGLLGCVINVAPASAPSIAGIVIDLYNWTALFWIMLSLSVVALVFAYLFMKNVTEQQAAKLDPLSLCLSGIGFTSILFGMSNISVLGFTHWSVLASLAIGGMMLATFIKRQLNLQFPVLNLRIFKKMAFLISTALIFINIMLLLSMETILPMFSQDVLGTSAFLSGFLLVPGTIILSIVSLISGHLFDQYGGRILAMGGFSSILVSTILFSTIGMESSPYMIMIYFCFFMFGTGLTLMPLVSIGVESLSTAEIPHGAAIVNTVRQFGMAFGIVFLTTIISVTTNQMEAPYEVAAFWGTRYAFYVMIACSLLGICLSFLVKGKQRLTVKEDRGEVVNG
ncbi:DHA2 family efflux MFS transporter permease subunit [Desertibacillus haloalkaliphilus]|uniref:DHA2 family efflux MFS transporter permease subunit n=1 Tax=Desertibacillus haloalkaliphilus TaxID=1328930 RepID=UPI001C26D25D|nr:DHA2 family efflux MFS transporter permease subunit [Desertibacillus haloalkaliphilus]MBU8907660.1 DHA2 family efflux MFS transporter permease subunit [Desertibacillus haloalkaliphilus]